MAESHIITPAWGGLHTPEMVLTMALAAEGQQISGGIPSVPRMEQRAHILRCGACDSKGQKAGVGKATGFMGYAI